MENASTRAGDPEELPLRLEQAKMRVALERVSGEVLRLALALSDLGACSLEMGQPAEALPALQEARSLFDRLGLTAQEQRATGSVGLALAFMGQGQAESFLEVGLRAAMHEGDFQEAVLLSQNLVTVLLQLHQLERARTIAEWGLQMCPFVDESEEAQGGLEQVLGIIALGQGRFTDAVAHFLQSLKPLTHLPPTQRNALEAASGRFLAHVYFQLGDEPAATRWSERSAELYAELGQPDLQFSVVRERAHLAIERGSKDAFRQCSAAVELARRQEDPLREIDALLLLGTAYRRAGQKRKALAAWKDGAALADELEDAQSALRLHEHIATLQSEMGHTIQALVHDQAALKYARQLNDQAAQARACEGLAVYEATRGHVENMGVYFQAARRCLRQLDDSTGEARSFLQQAEVLNSFQDFDGRDVSLLGLLRYGLDLLRALSTTEDREAQEALQWGEARLSALRASWGEEWYGRMWQASAAEYARHGEKREEDRAFQIWRRQSLEASIEADGLLRYEQGYDSARVAEALSLLGREDMGYRHIALASYEQALHTFRRQHDRLQEAIIAGAMALIHQATNPAGEAASHREAFMLFREAGELLGQGRALYNEAVRLAALPDRDEPGALAHLRAACHTLGLAQANPGELGAVHARLDAARARLGELAYAMAEQEGQRAYQRLLPEAGSIAIYRQLWKPEQDFWTYHKHREQRVRVAQASSFPEALSLVIPLALEEASRAQPEQLEIGFEGPEARIIVTVCGTLKGEEGNSPANPDSGQEPLVRARFLKRDWQNRENPTQLIPLRLRSAEGMKPGVQLLSRTALREQAVDYLDQRASEAHLDARAVELLDQGEQPVVVFECLYFQSSAITDFVSDLLPQED